MAKRCKRGKSCGGTCISRAKVCLIEMPQVSEGISNVKSIVQERTKVKKKEPSGPPPLQRASQSLKGSNDKGSIGAKVVKNTLEEMMDPASKYKITDFKGEIAADKVNWEAALGKGARVIAAGANGAFVDLPPENLAKGLKDKFPDGVGVKYGEISKREVELLRLAGESGAAPIMIAARTMRDGTGMIAMERVPGVTMYKAFVSGGISESDLSDKYISSIAKLHKMGIAHGDAHLKNVILQPDGKAKFIDLGASQRLPSEVLMEALRAADDIPPFYNDTKAFKGGFSGPLTEKLRGNLKAIEKSGKMDEFRTAGFGSKQREDIATELIKSLYEGI